jgi:hypothetical protein
MTGRCCAFAVTLASLAIPVVLTASCRRDAVCVRIGSHAVTREQLRLRQAHADVLYPDSGKPEVALSQLIEGYLAAELMAREGVELDRDTWEAEAARIERATRDRPTLEKLKAVYAGRRDDYLYIGILPDFARSRLFRLFQSSSKVSEETRRDVSAFLDVVETHPERFAAEATRAKAVVTRWRVQADTGMRRLDSTDPADATVGAPDASPKSDAELAARRAMREHAESGDVEGARSLLERLTGIGEGAVYPRTLETPESFVAARLVHRDASGAEVEMATFAKPDFGSYFARAAASIPVRVHGPALLAALREKVPWARDLRIEAE